MTGVKNHLERRRRDMWRPWWFRALGILLWVIIIAVLTAFLSLLAAGIWCLVALVYTGLAMPSFWKVFLIVWAILLFLTELPLIGLYLFIEAEAKICDIRLRGIWRAKKRVAEARSKGKTQEEQALEMAKQAAELDDQEGIGEIKVVTDKEE